LFFAPYGAAAKPAPFIELLDTGPATAEDHGNFLIADGMMHTFSKRTALIFSILAVGVSSLAQVPSRAVVAVSPAAAEHAASLAESGRCAEALPILTKAAAHIADKELQKRVALDGVRCATALQQQEPLQELLRLLSRQFPHDPEVLYVLTHAYSDLSARAARELAGTAPNSIPALEMDADANEQQGKWDAAEKDYRKILEQNPRYPGIHFRLARLLLSKPNPAPDFAEQAKKELQEELAIDPANAGAEYVLGELARQAADLPEAVKHFSRASQFDTNFADAYLGLGMSLLAEKQYPEAVAPLEMAVKLQPGNPAGHYSLATAYARTGRKQDAEREFALQQKTSGGADAQGAQTPQ
jgi:tetratricopeptide (TPR) repeat protein